MSFGKKIDGDVVYKDRVDLSKKYQQLGGNSNTKRDNSPNSSIIHEKKKKKLTPCQIAMIIIGIVVVLIGVITAIIIITKRKGEQENINGGNETNGNPHNQGNNDDNNQGNNDNNNNQGNNDNNNNQGNNENDEGQGNNNENEGENNKEEISDDQEKYSVDDLKKVFEPSFKLNSQIDTLSQIVMKSKQNLITKSNNALDYTFIKAKFDSYILSESDPETENESNFFKKKYITSLIINSFCVKSEGTDCEYIPYLDLTYKEDRRNLRSLDEDEVNLEDTILPICLFEHSDTNILISISCPSLLEENLKEVIINAFRLMKPETIKGFKQNKTLEDTTIESKDDKIYINSFSYLCEDNEEEIDEICETVTNITTKDEYLISSNKKIKTETNSISNEYFYNFENITSENSELDPVNYKLNLNSLLNLVKNYMVKDVLVTDDSFKELLEPNKNDENLKNSRRNLAERISQNMGAQEVSFFETEYNNIKVSFNLSDNIINKDTSKTLCKLKAGNEINESIFELSHNEIRSNLTSTIEGFKKLFNAVNNLACNLFNNLNSPLLEVNDKLNNELTGLYNYLPFKNLLSVFDSTFVISGIKEFPYTIVTAAQNTYNNIKSINDDLLYIINDAKTKLNDDISTFISNLHNKVYNIFNNLKELNSAISSKKGKIASIATYYCGISNANNSLVNQTEQAKNILDNYYIDEKNLIEGQLNELFNNFTKKSENLIINGHYIFDNITNRLQEENITIKKGDEDDIKDVITNLYNTKLLENKFISKIIENMKKNIILKNGYLISQQEIDDNKNSYSPIAESILNTAKSITNNEYIDEVFDNIMKYYRNGFINILKNIENSKETNFPLKSDILSGSISLDDLDFSQIKQDIKNWFENGNKNFRSSIERNISDFIENNKAKLEDLITKIDRSLSVNILDNINNSYNAILIYVKGNITNILNENNKLLLSYLNDVSSSTHFTQTIKNKVNIYLNRINEIKSYVQNNLRTDLINIYKNIIINQVRKSLQSIKSNSIINKYSNINNLSFLKSHIDTIIDPLFIRLNEKISDEKFNKIYLPEINNNIINYLINLINQQYQIFNSKYTPISKKASSSDSTYDIYYYVPNRCCKRKWYGKKKCWDCSYYNPNNVGSTNNHLSLKNINFENYSKDFIQIFNEKYKIFSNNVISYNEIINNFGNVLQPIINSYSNKNVDFLNSISETAKSFINNQLGNNVLALSYEYYKNDLVEKLPVELKSIFNQFKDLFDKVYEDIDLNINKFKYPINEFSTLAMIYSAFYSTNISYDYLDSVVEQRKNDFNYTIKYYYNLFISKINKIYTYILNNAPTNEKPFNDVLNNQISQINNSYEEIINMAHTSQNNIINLKNQLKYLNTLDTNFFKVNEFGNNIMDEIEDKIIPYYEKFEEIEARAPNKYDSEESVATRFYLENSENAKQIDDIYDNINKGTFIDFQYRDYQELFKKVLEIDEKSLQNKILDYISNSNEKLNNLFIIRKQNYMNKLKNEIYDKMYKTEDLKNLINVSYSEGINNLSIDSKNKILNLIDDIISKLEEIMKREQNRLLNTVTSYSYNFDKINDRINNLKKDIFNQFNNTIHSVIKTFYSQIKQKFYIDYIEKDLNEYYNTTLKENFREEKILNITFNLKEIIIEDLEIKINEYKKIALDQINYLYEKKTQYLDDLFSIKKLENSINDKIGYLYNNTLFSALDTIEKYNSGDEQITDYDLNADIINEINTKISTNINEAKKLIEGTKGTKFDIVDNWKRMDFSLLKRNLYKDIKDDFNNNFFKIYNSSTYEEFDKEISIIINKNFQQIIEDFVPSFGIEYFERILKYNEVQKIKSLYSNLKYSIGITLSYYIYISSTSEEKTKLMPYDLAKKIMSLNDINSVVSTKNNKVLLTLANKFDDFLNLTKTNLIKIFMETIESRLNIENKFNEEIWNLTKDILESQEINFQNLYYSLMNKYIKSPFIESYSNVIKKETNDMLDYIEENRELLKLEINDLTIMNNDDILNNIETKLNNTSNSIKEYYSSFKFNVSNEAKEFLDNFVETNILFHHKEVKVILDSNTKNLIFDNLNISIKDFNDSFKYENIELKLNNTNSILNSLFDAIIKILKDYGTIRDIYSDNLEKEIIQISDENNNLRRLENLEGKFNVKAENTFKSLNEISKSVKQYIQDTNLFKDFNDKIDNYINLINDQYESSKILIKDRKYTEDISKKLFQILDDLRNNANLYYNNVKEKYNKIKEYTQNSIIKVNDFIENGIKVTYDTINEKYNQIKNNYNSIEDKINEEENIENIEINESIDKKNYHAVIIIDGFLHNNEFKFDINDNEGIPELSGKSINSNRPRSFIINFSKKVGKCIQDGKIMTINLNNITSNITLDFDSSSIQTKIIKNYNFDQYNIHYSYYNETEKPIKKRVGGVLLNKIDCVPQEIQNKGEEKDIIQSINKTKIDIY